MRAWHCPAILLHEFFYVSIGFSSLRSDSRPAFFTKEQSASRIGHGVLWSNRCGHSTPPHTTPLQSQMRPLHSTGELRALKHTPLITAENSRGLAYSLAKIPPQTNRCCFLPWKVEDCLRILQLLLQGFWSTSRYSEVDLGDLQRIETNLAYMAYFRPI
jgi:hypothetical protein